MTQYVWLYVGAGKRTHAVRAPGRAHAMAVCGTSPAWHDPTGWRGMDRGEHAHADQLDHCGRCTRILGDPARPG